ncbi:unnamed protein product [Rotaria magnacalcarata]|nr:unnamed protein product [Rotaria magnacalcarata]
MLHGKLVEMGTHTELMSKKNGVYAELMRIQQSGPGESSATTTKTTTTSTTSTTATITLTTTTTATKTTTSISTTTTSITTVATTTTPTSLATKTRFLVLLGLCCCCWWWLFAGRRRRRRADRESKKKPKIHLTKANSENISCVTVIKLPREMSMTPGGNIIKVEKSNIPSRENTQLSDKSFSTIHSTGSVRTSKVNRSSLTNKAQTSHAANNIVSPVNEKITKVASFITLPSHQ